ncbi:hypothetical protein [Stackebrandtia albiflava]|nr:hypothetical protein [Stackebrandtia albiflava]
MDMSTSRFPAALDNTHPTTTRHTTTGRPRVVTVAAILQFAVAVGFASIPVVRLMFGADVQAAAEAEAARQGRDPGILTDAGLRFDETGVAIWAPFIVAVLVALPAALNLAGRGRILSWVVLPLVLIGNVMIMASNAAAADTLQAFFDASSDPALSGLDATALLAAAYSAYPEWLSILEAAWSVVIVGGCVGAVVLLALKPSRLFFRRK